MKKSGTPGLHVKVGDTVTVLSGNDRGKTGKVIKSLPRESKVVVEGINVKTKHNKADNGGVVQIERPLDASNVALADKKSTAKPKVGTKKTTTAKKATVAKKVKSETKTKKTASKDKGKKLSQKNPSTNAQDK